MSSPPQSAIPNTKSPTAWTATVSRWIAEATREKLRLESLLGQASDRLTKGDVKDLVASLRDITAAWTAADPADKAAAYAELGVTVTYHAVGRVVLESRPGVVNNGVGGATRTVSPPAVNSGIFPAAA